jgi:hypothetical protein
MSQQPTAEQVRQGVRLLRDLLPWARAEAKKRGNDHELMAGSALGKSQFPYITEDNFVALVIYPAPFGGWHADMLLKNVPPGVPNSIGSPVATPYETREKAEAYAKEMLIGMLVQAARSKAEPPSNPAFLFYDWEIKLQRELLDKLLAQKPDATKGYGSEEAAIARLEGIVAGLEKIGFHQQNFDSWPIEWQNRLMSVVYMAALSGLFVYPPRQDAPPVKMRH